MAYATQGAEGMEVSMQRCVPYAVPSVLSELCSAALLDTGSVQNGPLEGPTCGGF